MESTLKFTVNQDLLQRLRDRHNIDTNPENGDFDFDVDCEVLQDGQSTDQQSMRVDVQKVSYNNYVTCAKWLMLKEILFDSKVADG